MRDGVARVVPLLTCEPRKQPVSPWGSTYSVCPQLLGGGRGPSRPLRMSPSECPDRPLLSTVLIREIWDILLHAGNPGSCGTRAALRKRGGVSSDLPREHIGGNLARGVYQLTRYLAARMVALAAGFAHVPQLWVKWRGRLQC